MTSLSKIHFPLRKKLFFFDHNLFMASRDDKSLFINIPVGETIKNTVDDLFLAIHIKGNPLRVNSVTF